MPTPMPFGSVWGTNVLEEVIIVPVETRAEKGRAASKTAVGEPSEELREWARKHVERVRRLKLPWILYVFLVWGGLLAIEAPKTYFDRPTTAAEIDRELRCLESDQ